MKYSIWLSCLLFSTTAFTYEGYISQQQDFLKDSLSTLVQQYSSSLKVDLRIVDGSIRLETPPVASTALGMFSIGRNQYCTKVDFKLTDSKNVFDSHVYLFIQDNASEKNKFLNYSKLYPGNLVITMTAGCLGFDQIHEPVLDLNPTK